MTVITASLLSSLFSLCETNVGYTVCTFMSNDRWTNSVIETESSHLTVHGFLFIETGLFLFNVMPDDEFIKQNLASKMYLGYHLVS